MSSGEHRRPFEPTRSKRQFVAAIESLLVEKGLITTDAIDTLVDTYERDRSGR